ncbi:MAG TPA: MgtC/SapB family protein [Planctomycetota bacterium]|jgi:putative Mg2+ transporter-C (MgtC) family protein|nr:MgtC/SapB family protein [Planctomycetota bacterium]
MPHSDSLIEQLSRLDPLPLLAALVVGGLIGFEREIHGRPAGLRTHMLVCLASAVLVQASRVIPSGLQSQGDAFRVVLDPNRLAAGIVTGIGFLGAATVIRAGDIVRGITTGATVWSVAGLGIVVGQGEYALALVASVIILMVLAVVDRFTRGIAPVIYRRLVVRGERSELTALASTVGELLAVRGIRLQDLSGNRGGPELPFELVFHIRCRNVKQAPEMLELIAAQKGVTSVEWSEISH